MKISKEHSDQIAKNFDAIKDMHDFVSLLNYTFNLERKNKKDIFTLRRLNYLAFHFHYKYTSFKVLKKNGKTRKIKAPKIYLKLLQQCINTILQTKFVPHHASHGFLTERNIVTNAKPHIGKNYVLNIDLKDFFDSVNFRRVKTVLELNPFNLNNEREKIAYFISNICCDKGTLPQGSPTSPLITNIVCQRLDRKLYQFSKTSKSKYSRYADDITFSSNNAVFTKKFIKELTCIIKVEGFKINQSKTRIQDRSEKQEVTGLKVNEKVNVDRKRIKTIRAMFHNFQNKGYAYTQQNFEKFYDKQGSKAPSFEISLKGQIEFVGMVRGKNDALYSKYNSLYNKCFSKYIINYSFITDEKVKNQLSADNQKMIDVTLDFGLLPKSRFVNFCVFAFLQVEELINYYLSTKFTFEQLKNELTTHTLLTNKALKGRDNITMIAITYKIFLFEKYFYYKPGVYYDSILTTIRIIRNNELHRQSSTARTEEAILNEFSNLQDKIKLHKQTHNVTDYQMSYKERHLENEFKAVKFINSMDYGIAYNSLRDLCEKIKAN